MDAGSGWVVIMTILPIVVLAGFPAIIGAVTGAPAIGPGKITGVFRALFHTVREFCQGTSAGFLWRK